LGAHRREKIRRKESGVHGQPLGDGCGAGVSTRGGACAGQNQPKREKGKDRREREIARALPKTQDVDRDTRGKNAWGDQGADMAVISGFYHVWAWVLVQIRFE
jgi:hypothetical protein